MISTDGLAEEKACFSVINELLSPCDFGCRLIDGYRFDGKKRHWPGAFVVDEQTDASEFPIAINLPLLEEMSEDDETFSREILKTVAYECGIGLLGKLKDDDFRIRGQWKGTDRLAEEFAEYAIGERESSSISDTLKLDDYGAIRQLGKD